MYKLIAISALIFVLEEFVIFLKLYLYTDEIIVSF